MITSNVWTYTLTSSTITIDETFDLVVLSILATSGSCTIIGSLTASGLPSQSITLNEGQSLTVSSSSGSALLSGIEITSSGTTVLTGR
jgi:hypothetical protein